MRTYHLIFRNLIIMAGILLFTSPALAFAQTVGANQAASASQDSAQNISGGTALNWAGYVSDTGTYTSVSGSWTVPAVTDVSANGADATWVGIGGVLSHDLIQTGTEAVPDSKGGIDYQAWYELLPSGSVTVPLSVHAGDTMTATIMKESSANTIWLITLTDTTTGNSYSTTVTYASSENSAEWIEEMPAGVGTSISLDDFGTVHFTGGTTIDNGSSVSIAGSGATALTMANAENQPLAVPSVLGADGESFSVTRTDATSNAIGLRGIMLSYGYGGYATSTGATTYYTVRPRYRVMRSGYYYPSYPLAGGNGMIRIVINGASRF